MSELEGNTEIRMGSERSFALVFSGVFVIIACFPLLGEGSVRLWSLGVAAVFLGAGVVRPEILRPLNRLWFRFGLLLNKIISPIVMGIIFFVAVTPVGLIRRLFVRDMLNQRLDPDRASYWIDIDPDRPDQTSMRNQF